MLEQILGYIHNYFEKRIYRGQFKIESKSLVCDFLQEGQYFRIRGSIFNDGVYKYSEDELHDEEFIGEVWSLAIPPAVIELVSEIDTWVQTYGDVTNNPYSSESFGGYSYTKMQGYASSGGNNMSTWQSVFENRLNQWRKIS